MHSDFLYGKHEALYYITDQLCRFSVPFFFTSAGYLLALRMKKNPGAGPFEKYLGRLLLLCIAWNTFYLLIPSPMLISRHGILEGAWLSVCARAADIGGLLRLWSEGTAEHLWFFSAIISAFVFLYAFRKPERRAMLISMSAALYVIGLLGGSYSATPLGVRLEYDTRNGPFFSTLFVVIGFLFGAGGFKASTRAAVSLIIAGIGIQAAEVTGLKILFGVPMDRHDFLIGTVLTGTGLILLAIGNPGLGRGSLLAKCGKYTLGIYALHWAVDKAYLRLFTVQSLAWHLAHPVTVFLVSLSLALIVSRIPKAGKLMA